MFEKQARKIRRAFNKRPGVLFEGSDRCFKEIVSRVRVYAEYGMGKSTVWVLQHTDAKILAVEGDPKWIEKVRDEAGAPDRLDCTHVDLGRLLKYGRPADYSRRENFVEYTDAIWRREDKPEAVLIDGRFRVCCFLTSLKHAEAGTYIVFDDYTDRPHYDIVETFLAPRELCGRQAVFQVPERDTLDLPRISDYIDRFRYVMD
jgi:hypothetical protein